MKKKYIYFLQKHCAACINDLLKCKAATKLLEMVINCKTRNYFIKWSYTWFMPHVINIIISFANHHYPLAPFITLNMYVTLQVVELRKWKQLVLFRAQNSRAWGFVALSVSGPHLLGILNFLQAHEMAAPWLHPLIYGHPSHWLFNIGIYAWQHSQCHLQPINTCAHTNTPQCEAPLNIVLFSQPTQKLFIKFVSWWYRFIDPLSFKLHTGFFNYVVHFTLLVMVYPP